MNNKTKRDVEIIKSASEDYENQAYLNAESNDKYYALVNRLKKDMKKNHPEIKEEDLDLYL